MNKEVVLETIVSYFGEEYKEDILNSLKRIKFNFVKENSGININDVQIYMGQEPICYKSGNETHIILPESILSDENANVLLMHSIMHSLGEECLVIDGNEIFNEVVVDYYANQLCKIMEKKKVNLVDVEFPKYSSSSQYAVYFPVVKEFCEQNKDKIIKSRLTGENNIAKDDILEMVSSLKKASYASSVKRSSR